MPPTIKEVAREAGVSVATVSRVLNGSGYFDEETARKVRGAVERLGYRRNVHWKRLKRNSSDTISFLLGNREAMNSMQMRLLVASERVCHERGLDVVFSSFRYSAETKASQLVLPRVLAEQGVVDGVILAGQHSANLLEALDQARIPWVLAGNNFVGPARCTSLFTVYYDEQGGIADAARYLARLGHRRIAFVGNAALPWFRRRLEAFRAALASQARSLIEVCEDWRVSNVEYGCLSAARLLRLSRRPTAILAANDEIAAGVWMELTQQSVRIPAEMSLVGFGDREEFQILRPALSTVSVFPQKLGASLAEMLIQRMENPKARIESRVFPCQLMERASCGPPPG
jgi:LacI family transcriptional regulator